MPAYCRRKCGIFWIRLSLLFGIVYQSQFFRSKTENWSLGKSAWDFHLVFMVFALPPERNTVSLSWLEISRSFFSAPENCWFSLCSSSFCFLHHFRKLQSGATPLKLIKGLAEKFSLVLLHLPVFYSPREREKLLGAALLVAVFSLMAFSRHFCKFSRARLSLASSPKSIKQKTICWPILFFL